MGKNANELMVCYTDKTCDPEGKSVDFTDQS